MGLSNAERQARWRERQKAKFAELQRGAQPEADAEIPALKAKLAHAKQEIAALKAELADMVGARFAPRQRAAKPRTEKAPLPPDEERDRIIKGLKTRVHNLTAELRASREWIKHGADTGMNFKTMSAIAKALHPDHKPSEAERAEACKLFTAWKGDKDKARRK